MNMKKIMGISMGIILTLAVVVFWNEKAESDKNNTQFDKNTVFHVDNSEMKSVNRENIEKWMKKIIGKKVEIKNGRLWIDGVNTYIPVKETLEDQTSIVKVKKCKQKENGHVLLTLSNDVVIDLGEKDTLLENLTYGEESENHLEEAANPQEETAKHIEKEPRESTEPIRAGEPYLYVTKKKDKKQGVLVAVKVKNNPGILGMTLSVHYDEDKLVLRDAKNGKAVEGILSMTKGKKYESGCKFTWDGQEIKNEDVKDGELLVLDFDFVSQTKEAAYHIDIKCEDDSVVDNHLLSIPIKVMEKEIKIS